MTNTKAVFRKQFLSYISNPIIISVPFMFILMTLIFTLFIPDAEDAFVNTFAVMYVSLSLVGSSSAFIIEDRATSNLRFMSMAGVKSSHYLFGTFSALFLWSLIGLSIFAIIGFFNDLDILEFLIMTMLGATASIFLGITLGLSKIPLLIQPVAMILAFGPIIAENNDTVGSIFYFIYTQQINLVLNDQAVYEEGYGYIYNDTSSAIPIILMNIAVTLVLFIVTNIKNGLYRDGASESKPSKKNKKLA